MLVGKLDSYVDSLFEKIPMPPNQTIVVHIKEDNGMGDLMLAAKTVKSLKAKYPDVDIQVSLEVATISMKDAIAKIQYETKGANLKEGSISSFDNRPHNAKEPNLIIIMPTDACLEAEKLWGNFKNPPEKIMLKEYGWGDALESGGLGTASLGIFLHSGLSKLLDTKTDGQGITELSSKQASGLILNDKDATQYTKSNKLYFAYAHLPNPSAGFLKSIILMNEGDHGEDKKNLDFFMRTENSMVGVEWNLQISDNELAFMDSSYGTLRKSDS
ncbi:MAG: hypothetical protein H0T62_12275 [Parachlamydiaceae bacterium]|nr:hypothetical protein [Parachlamydiaceae bacterium]